MNCLTFKKNFESREALKGSMLSHAESCESCRAFADEELKLDGLLSELSDIDAPDSFVRSVRSRIEERRSPLSGLWATARVAVPVAAMLLIVGLVVVNSDIFSPSETQSDGLAIRDKNESPDRNDRRDIVEETDGPDEPGIARDQGDQDKVDARTDPASGDSQVPRRTPALAGIATSGKKRGPLNNGGSIDSADSASEEVEITNPPGLEPGEPVKTPPSLPTEEFTAIGILKTLGIRAAWKSGRLFVVSVSPGSVGFRSGLKKGDRVIALDGRPVSEDDTALGRVKGDTLTIRRAGRQILIKIGVQN